MIYPAATADLKRGTGVRLAICSAGELFGGVERHILGFCQWLQERGTSPIVILFHDQELAARLRELGLKPRIMEWGHPYDFRTINKLGRLLAAEDIQIVHAHGYRAVVNCALANMTSRIALVRTVHGMVEPGPGISLRGMRSRFYTWLEQSFGRRTQATVTYVSEDLRNRHRRIDRGLATFTIHNGIYPLNKSDFPPPPEWDSVPVNLVVIGRLTAVKGLDYLLRALADLESEREYCVSILGAGPQANELRATIIKLGLSGRVRLLGFRQDAYNFLANADALLMPSLHEGLPYSILEAMSMGIPILASSVGGIKEILCDGETGVLFPSQDVPRLRLAIQSALADPARMQRIGHRAQLDFEQRFRIEKMAQAYLALYGSLVDGRTT
jgi:glycosyltransferase involved in cell wall biosynthesis